MRSMSQVSDQLSFRARLQSNLSEFSEMDASYIVSDEHLAGEEEDIEALLQFRLGWRTILLLPFETMWAWCVMLLGFVATVNAVMQLSAVDLDFGVRRKLNLVNAVIDAVFVIDNILVICCKLMHGLRIPYTYIRRPNTIIILELLTIIPSQMIFNENDSNSIKFSSIVEVGQGLKLLRTFHCFYYHLRLVGKMPLQIYLIQIVSLVVLNVVIWYSLHYTVTCILNGPCNTHEGFVEFCRINDLLTLNSMIKSPKRNELWSTILGILIGLYCFLVLISLLIGGLVATLTNIHAHKHLHLFKITSAENKLKQLQVSSHNRQRAMTFYDIFWRRKRGYNLESGKRAFTQVLAPAMWNEIIIDISWYALKHSKLFQNMDLSFLRALSLVVHQTFLLPGEILYQKNKDKHMMAYIVSGIVEVLSEEDGETPIISFSAGTCLGECSLVANYISSATVKCKEYAEIHVLKMDDFVKVACNFPKQFQKLKKSVYNRYYMTKIIHRLSEYVIKEHDVEKPKQVRIMWIKNTLHRLMMKDGDLSSKHECQNIFLREELSQERFSRMQFTAKYLDLLAITERLNVVSDKIFVKYSFPWVFQPNSIILLIWETIITGTAIAIAYIYVYFAFVQHKHPAWYAPFSYTILFLYWMDVILKVVTAIRTKDQFVRDIKTIFLCRLEDMAFWADVAAAFPLQVYSCLLLTKVTAQSLACLKLNRLLKMYKIKQIFDKFGQRQTVILVKYLLYYLYIVYVLSCLIYATSCFDGECAHNIEGSTPKEKLWSIFFTCTQIIAATGLDSGGTNFFDFYVLYTMAMYVSMFLFLLVAGGYGARCVLRRLDRAQLISSILDIASVMKAHKLEPVYVARVFDYVRCQWFFDRCQTLVYHNGVLSDIPNFIYKSLKEDAVASIIREIPVFADLREEILCELCVVAKQQIFPPREVIMYSGGTNDSFFYIKDGYCELISSLSKAREGILGPNDCISVLEVCMQLPVMNTTITLTHCVVLTFNIDQVRNVFTKYSGDYSVVKAASDDEEIHQKLMFMNKRASHDTQYDLERDLDGSKSFHYFGFNLALDSPEEYDYFVPFDNLDLFSWIRIFFMRFTIMPFGMFIFVWEGIRISCALLSALLFIITPITTCKECEWAYFLAFLDTMAYIDIYVRLHVCYYDDRGIIITHPLKTAVYYIKHGFLIDLLGIIPTRYLVINKASASTSKMITLLRANRLLQMHRFFGFFQFMDIAYLVPYKFLYVIKYFPILLVVSNACGSIIFNLACDMDDTLEETEVYMQGIRCSSSSMFTMSNFSKPLHPLTVHVLGVYHVVGLLTTIGMKGQVTITFYENLIEAVLSYAGILFVIYLCGQLIALSCTGHHGLIYYQSALQSAKFFMSSNRIQVAVQKHLIQHYELKWRRKRGKDLHQLTRNYSRALSTDLIYATYGVVLEKYSIFPENSKSFFRSMLSFACHTTYYNRANIAYVNDVKASMYIIFKGRIDVIAPDGTKLATLGIGSMCGNLDNYPLVRQTINLIANGHVELISIRAVAFHEVLKSYPDLQRKFKMLTAMHIDYLQGRYHRIDNYDLEAPSLSKSSGSVGDISRYSNIFTRLKFIVIDPRLKKMAIWQTIKLTIVCYLATISSVYEIAVYEFSTHMTVFHYICDIFYAIDFCLRYHMAYEDEFGILVKDLNMIKEKVKNEKFNKWFSIASILPLDLIAWILPVNWHLRLQIFGWLRLNKLIRIYYIFRYLKGFQNKIDVNLYLLDAGKLIFFITLYIHMITCSLIWISCKHTPNMDPPVKCEIVLDYNIDSFDKLKVYLHYLRVVLRCLIAASQEEHPVSNFLLVFFTILMCINIIMFARIIADFCKMHQMSTFLKIEYEQMCNHLMYFLESENVSYSLVKRVWSYLTLLWKRQKGTVYPSLLSEAPKTLRSTIMNAAFCHHAKKNFIFKKCHEDFIRQLVEHMHIAVFFDGDYIVFKGDINDQMYFIHDGSVIILSEDTLYKEDVVGKLVMGQSFGIMQGLYPFTPHVYSFRSCTTTVVLSLHRNKWHYLLDYFPASKEIIFEAAANYSGF